MADRLTALDSSFLHLEDASSHMHVASVTIFEGPPPSHQELIDHIERRLALVPRFRQKLRFVPLNQGRPVWVDDPHFNLDYHVRTTALPPPGNEEQLKRLAGRVFSQQLDRTKPLWEIWLVHGLDRGDGTTTTARAASRCCPRPTTRWSTASRASTSRPSCSTPRRSRETEPAAGPPWVARPEPTSAQLFGEALLERITQPAEIVRSARAVVPCAADDREGRSTRRPARSAALAKSGLGAPPSSLNVDIGPHRRFDWIRTDLDDAEGDQERARRHRQRRRAGGGRGRAAALPARTAARRTSPSWSCG